MALEIEPDDPGIIHNLGLAYVCKENPIPLQISAVSPQPTPNSPSSSHTYLYKRKP